MRRQKPAGMIPEGSAMTVYAAGLLTVGAAGDIDGLAVIPARSDSTRTPHAVAPALADEIAIHAPRSAAVHADVAFPGSRGKITIFIASVGIGVLAPA